MVNIFWNFCYLIDKRGDIPYFHTTTPQKLLTTSYMTTACSTDKFLIKLYIYQSKRYIQEVYLQNGLRNVFIAILFDLAIRNVLAFKISASMGRSVEVLLIFEKGGKWLLLMPVCNDALSFLLRLKDRLLNKHVILGFFLFLDSSSFVLITSPFVRWSSQAIIYFMKLFVFLL